jgi:hypothetical protein
VRWEEEMGAAVGFSYLIGIAVTWVILYQRAGFPEVHADWREFLLPNLPWFGLMILKFWFWPVTFAAWLIDGREPSRWRAVTQLNGRPVRKIMRLTPSTSTSKKSYNQV